MSTLPDYYEILQVSPNAESEVIQAAYKRLVDKWHTERKPGDSSAFERLALLDEACQVLSDEQNRQNYDLKRKQLANCAVPTHVSQPGEITRPPDTQQAVSQFPAEEVSPSQVASAGQQEAPPALVDMAGDEGTSETKDPQGVVSIEASVLFVIGMVLFVASQQLDPLSILARCVVWGAIFGIPAYLCLRNRKRAGLTGIAALFLLAAGFDAAIQHVTRRDLTSGTKASQVRVESPQSKTSSDLPPSHPALKPEVSEKDASYYVQRGRTWFEKGDYEKAIEDYDEAIRLDPSNAQAFYQRAVTWFSSLNSNRDVDKAIEDFNEAIRLNPDNVTALLNRGNAWSIQKEYAKAISDYTEVIRRDPKDSGTLYNRGNTWMQMGMHDDAIKDYSEAIRIDSNNPLLYSNRGLAWSLKGDCDKAIKDFDEAIRLDPSSPLNFTYRGIVWSVKNQLDEAINDFDEAIRLDPNNKLARSSRSDALLNKVNAEKPEEKFKDNLRRGLTPQQVYDFADMADKTETYLPGAFLADFNFRVPKQGAAVVRFIPFEVPGEAIPRYRVNLLFVHAGNSALMLEDWYYRSPSNRAK